MDACAIHFLLHFECSCVHVCIHLFSCLAMYSSGCFCHMVTIHSATAETVTVYYSSLTSLLLSSFNLLFFLCKLTTSLWPMPVHLYISFSWRLFYQSCHTLSSLSHQEAVLLSIGAWMSLLPAELGVCRASHFAPDRPAAQAHAKYFVNGHAVDLRAVVITCPLNLVKECICF